MENLYQVGHGRGGVAGGRGMAETPLDKDNVADVASFMITVPSVKSGPVQEGRARRRSVHA